MSILLAGGQCRLSGFIADPRLATRPLWQKDHHHLVTIFASGSPWPPQDQQGGHGTRVVERTGGCTTCQPVQARSHLPRPFLMASSGKVHCSPSSMISIITRWPTAGSDYMIQRYAHTHTHYERRGLSAFTSHGFRRHVHHHHRIHTSTSTPLPLVLSRIGGASLDFQASPSGLAIFFFPCTGTPLQPTP
jgi:hypothetical protein